MASTIEAILAFSAIVLACGSASLLFARISNRRLTGLGYMGASFAAGGLGAALLLLSQWVPAMLSVTVADILILTAFLLLHAAIREILGNPILFPRSGFVLLGTQTALDVLLIHGHRVPHLGRSGMAGLLIAVASGQAASILLKQRNRSIRVSATFNGAMLLGFTVLVTVRSLALISVRLHFGHRFAEMQAGTFILFIAFALGMAFGLFWMTTTLLTAGLEDIASTDPLTRIYNRRMFLLWCEKELARSEQTGHPFSVLMVDLDRFKSINDRFGHHTGDEALILAVERMQDSVRGIDVLGRWGGEEFTALLPSASADAALVVAERLRANIERTRLQSPALAGHPHGLPVQLTVSVGVATYRGPGDDMASMLRRADRRLYRAKSEGRNRVSAHPDVEEQPLGEREPVVLVPAGKPVPVAAWKTAVPSSMQAR